MRTTPESYRPTGREGSGPAALRATAIALALGLLAALAAPFPTAAQDSPTAEPPPVFGERIEVRLLSLRVRVVDDHGAPVLGLGPEDFVLEIGKREVPVEAVEWRATGDEIPSGLAAQPLPLRDRNDDLARFLYRSAVPGRLVVFFVQADFNASRLVGHVRVLKYLRGFLESLDRSDLFAVVSFDSHLKLRLDFTRDRLALEEALPEAIRHGPARRLTPGAFPSLAREWDHRVAEKVATPERALEETAKLLQRIPGEKLVVFIGYGFGTLSRGIVTPTDDYQGARLALQKAEATVFTLDVTDADFHSLEDGLIRVSEDTGGVYFKTHLFPEMAVSQLSRMTSGHYTLFFEAPKKVRRRGRVEVAVRDGVGKILAPRLEVRLPSGR